MKNIIAAAFFAALVSGAASAQTFLIDFGHNDSNRGTNVVNPDSNGNFWNSVHSTNYWPNIIDINGATTTVGFGFSSALGTDSYNGPAGTNENPAFVEIDAAALGDLGINEAVFDYYGTSLFTIQGLDPAKTYTLTFFGSHKFTLDTTTVYTVYTSNDYANAVASTTLDVRDPVSPWLHNSNQVAVIANVAPQFADSLWIGFKGAGGNAGFLNCMKIEEYIPSSGPNPVDISRIAATPSTITVAFTGELGVVYGLESTTNLLNPAGWSIVMAGSTEATGNGNGLTETTIADTNTAAPLRNYRVILAP